MIIGRQILDGSSLCEWENSMDYEVWSKAVPASFEPIAHCERMSISKWNIHILGHIFQ